MGVIGGDTDVGWGWDRVFVAGRPREEIMKDMRERIDRGDREAEKKAAIEVGVFFGSTNSPFPAISDVTDVNDRV